MAFITAQLKQLQEKQGIKFRNGYLNQGAKRLMHKDIVATMRDKDAIWKIDDQAYQSHKDKWPIIFQFMTQCKVKILKLSKNFRCKILKQISSVYFIQLKELYLCNNELQSIESLTTMNTPQLEVLDLSNNYITCIKALTHFDAPLKTLKLAGIPLPQLNQLERTSLMTLTCLALETSSQHRVVGQDISWLIKFPPLLKRLYCKSGHRIRQQQLWLNIEHKYPQGNFH